MKEQLPVYSLENFSSLEQKSQQFQVEVFDAKRHFSVKYPHRHDFFEVMFLKKGSGSHIIDGNKYEIKPPCVFFMSPGQAHKFEFSNDIDGYLYLFTSEFYLINKSNQNSLIEFPFFFTLQQDNPPLLIEEKGDVEFLEKLFLRGIAELKMKRTGTIDVLRSVLDLILTTCAASYGLVESSEGKGKGQILVKRFYSVLEENHQQNLSISQYAQLLSVSPNHLSQTLKKITGKTATQLIKAKQVLEIKRLLAHTNMTVAEVASQFNFFDQSYFSKFFKRETGLLPLQYRSKHEL